MSEYNVCQGFAVTGPAAEAIARLQESRARERAERLARWRETAKDHPRSDLINELIDEWEIGDEEGGHVNADQILLRLIDDDLVTEIFNDMSKWYA